MVVARLRDTGIQVRVMTRDPDSATGLRAESVEVVRGDVRERAQVRDAVRGCDVVVSAVHGFVGPGGVSPATVDRDGNVNLVSAAEEAGADVVLVSMLGAAADSPLELGRMKFAAEERLRAGTTGWTVVRAAPFLDLWLDVLEATASKSGRPVVFGRGENPIPFVACAEVARVVVSAVLDRSLRGHVLSVASPAPRTLNQLAAEIQESAGRTRAPRHVPRSVLHLLSTVASPFSAELSRQTRAALVMDRLPLLTDDGEPVPAA
jgi:NADH dehydrogenase